MIFVTVGTQYGFDRFIEAIDEWAGRCPQLNLFAQIGLGKYQPRNMEFQDFIDPTEFKIRLKSSDCIFAHAGMGSILLALENGKPIIVMPRDPELGEHQNSHQIATASRFKETGQIQVAMNEKELTPLLDAYADAPNRKKIGHEASSGLIKAIRNSINDLRYGSNLV